MKLKFKWESGSKNDNAIKLFKAIGLPFRYNHFCKLEVYCDDTWHPVSYEALGNNKYEVVI